MNKIISIIKSLAINEKQQVVPLCVASIHPKVCHIFKSAGFVDQEKYKTLKLMSEQMKNQAFQLAEILVDIHQEDYISFAIYADLLYADKQYQKAKEQYFLSLERNNSNQEIWAQILFIQADQKNYLELQTTSRVHQYVLQNNTNTMSVYV